MGVEAKCISESTFTDFCVQITIVSKILFNRTAQILKLFNFVECDIKKIQSHNEFVEIFNSMIFCLKKNIIRKLFNLFNDLMGKKFLEIKLNNK
jgi:hypothetical protein